MPDDRGRPAPDDRGRPAPEAEPESEPAPEPEAPGDRRSARAQVFVDDLGRPAPRAPDAHHLERVLRLRAGERVVAADGAGGWRWCSFRPDVDPAGMLEPVGPPQIEEPVRPLLTVAFAPVKGDRPEWVVQKLTELGVDRIVVLSADRSVVRWSGVRASRALGRLGTVAREAAAQSRRAWLPTIAGVHSLAELAHQLPPSHLALAEPGGGPPSLEHPAVAVGPEGGWSAEERSLGLPTTGLGPTVLRAETAATAAGVLLASLRAGTVGPGMPRPPDHP